VRIYADRMVTVSKDVWLDMHEPVPHRVRLHDTDVRDAVFRTVNWKLFLGHHAMDVHPEEYPADWSETEEDLKKQMSCFLETERVSNEEDIMADLVSVRTVYETKQKDCIDVGNAMTYMVPSQK
jgi:hypothetical protein